MFDDQRITAFTKRAPRTLAEAVWHVELRAEGATTSNVVLVRAPSMRVGSHEGNDLVLLERTVSRVHAELVPEPEGVRVRDLGSRNGTTINGVRVHDAVAEPGMTIAFGGGATIKVRTLTQEPIEGAPTQFGALQGSSAPMARLFTLAQKAAQTDSTVLLQAESGCGKELLARSIHDASDRKEEPFVVFDCAAMAPSLIESALFGHERGSFTGASERRVGLVEAAHGGTLFIDEIGDLPTVLQPRLLRFLERREVQRVGSNQVRAVDVRVIAATHRDLLAGVNEGTFREDLYYRLAVLRLRIPPLRERGDDFKMLAQAILVERLGDVSRAEAVVSHTPLTTWAALRAHPWRGNVRELRNVIDQSLALSKEGPLTLETESTALESRASAPAPGVNLAAPFIAQRDGLLEQFERTYLRGVLEVADGNFSRAATAAGLDRMYLKRLLRKHGIAE